MSVEKTLPLKLPITFREGVWFCGLGNFGVGVTNPTEHNVSQFGISIDKRLCRNSPCRKDLDFVQTFSNFPLPPAEILSEQLSEWLYPP